MIKAQNNTPKTVNKFVRDLLLSIYGESFPNYKPLCHRVYSESYNKGKSWRFKWWKVDSTKQEVYVKMIDYTSEVLKPRMKTLFNVSVNMKYLNGSLTLLTKPVK